MSTILPLPSDNDLPKEVVQRLHEKPPINIFRMFAHAPQCVIPWTDAVGALYKGTLSPREREIAIIRQGARAKAHYEVHQHKLIALANGITEAEIEAIVTFQPLASLSERESLICAVADQLECNAQLDDETYEKAIATFGNAQFVELLLLISFYSGVGRFTNGARLAIEKDNPLAGRATPN